MSGSELTRRAVAQARRLGAEFLAPLEVTDVSIEAGYKRIRLADQRDVVTPAMVIATGMTYREHEAAGICDYTGAGVYYGAATTEAQAVRGAPRARGRRRQLGRARARCTSRATPREVHLIVRRDGLRETMSHYLIEQIAQTPNIRVRPRTRAGARRGRRPPRTRDAAVHRRRASASRSRWTRCSSSSARGRTPTGCRPSILRDAKGFVLTGRDMAADPAFGRTWKEARDPLVLETSIPGVFAAGDVRAGALNRVAAAVGEGSTVVRLVHEYLALP